MKSIFYKKLLLIIFFFINFFGRNFSEETKVLTENGYVEIKNLKPGSFVLSENEFGEIEKSKIVVVHSKKIKGFLRLKIKNEILETTFDQEFYDQNNQLISLKNNFSKNNFSILKTLNNFLKIDSIEFIQEEKVFYDLTLLKNHNFFVTEKNIKVHNWFFNIRIDWVFNTFKDINFSGISAGIGGIFCNFATIGFSIMVDNYCRKAASIDVHKDSFEYQSYFFIGDPDCYTQNEPGHFDESYTKSLIVSTSPFSGFEIPTAEKSKNFSQNELQNNSFENSADESEVFIQIKNNDLIDSEEKFSSEIIEFNNNLEDEKYLVNKDFLDNVVQSTYNSIPDEFKIPETPFITISTVNENFLKNISVHKNESLIINYGNFLFQTAKDSFSNKIENPGKTLYDFSFGKLASTANLLKIGANLFLIFGQTIFDFEKGKNEFLNYSAPVRHFCNSFLNSDNDTKFKIASTILINLVIDSKFDNFLSFSLGKIVDKINKPIFAVSQSNLSKSELIDYSIKDSGQNLKDLNNFEKVLDVEKSVDLIVNSGNNKLKHVFFAEKHRFLEILNNHYGYSYEELYASIKDSDFKKYDENLKKIINIYFNSAIKNIKNEKNFLTKDGLIGYIHDYKVVFRGKIENGIFKLGTAFIPFDFKIGEK